MERATIHSNLNPKSPPFKDRDASFSSPPLTPDQPKKCEPHHAMRPSGLGALDHDSTSELSTFGTHKYFNQVTNNNDNNIQKVITINSNSRVSPLLNMDTEHKHNPDQGDITKSTRSFSYSASSSIGGNGSHNNMIINNYKAHSFHVATPTPPPSSSKSTLNNKAGLLFHHPQRTTISVINPPQTPSNLTNKLRTSLSKPIWLLRRKCPCNDKKSVQVKGNTNKNTPKPKTPPPPQPQPQSLLHNQIHKDSLNHKSPTTASSNKEVKSKRLFQPAMNQVRRPSSTEGFTFPLFFATNSTNPTKPHQVLLNVVHEEEDTTPRESLHVFQPPSPSKSRAMDDDAASDASSDLFEIESFSTQTTTLPCPIITPSIAQRHETTDHDFVFTADAGSSLWRRRRLRDIEVLPPPRF